MGCSARKETTRRQQPLRGTEAGGKLLVMMMMMTKQWRSNWLIKQAKTRRMKRKLNSHREGQGGSSRSLSSKKGHRNVVSDPAQRQQQTNLKSATKSRMSSHANELVRYHTLESPNARLHIGGLASQVNAEANSSRMFRKLIAALYFTFHELLLVTGQ